MGVQVLPATQVDGLSYNVPRIVQAAVGAALVTAVHEAARLVHVDPDAVVWDLRVELGCHSGPPITRVFWLGEVGKN